MIEYAAHFPQGDQFVRKELQSLLTDSLSSIDFALKWPVKAN